MTTATEEDIDDSLKQIIKGLRQLNEFGSAVIEKRQGLEDFHGCTEILSVIITHERLFLTNSTLFKDHVNNVYDEKFNDHSIKRFTWLILSVQELEILQPHLASGIDFVETIKKLIDAPYNEVVGHLEETTGKTYKDSFLYLKDYSGPLSQDKKTGCI